MLIRKETPDDFDEVYALVTSAFRSAEHSDGNEQELVVSLRKSSAFVPELSLVAQIWGKIAGHILFTEAKVGGSTVLALAPLSVLPEFQNRGVGSALAGAGHETAKKLGYNYSIVLGSEKYYPRFGYVPAKIHGVSAPAGIPPEPKPAVPWTRSARPPPGGLKTEAASASSIGRSGWWICLSACDSIT